MPQIPNTVVFPIAKDEHERALFTALSSQFQKISDAINGGLRFGDNNNVALISYTSSASAGTEDELTHNLKRVPVGYILVRADKAVALYDGATAWTTTLLYLKANASSAAVTVMVF